MKKNENCKEVMLDSKCPTQPHETSYGEAIREGFHYLLSKYPNVFAIGQGLWSPWYVGNSMTALEKDFGKDRVIDTPVAEAACTGAALGAALCGYRPIVIHPRMDFMILAVDQIVTQAAKWSSMFGGRASPSLTIRGIVNRGGEQGAQHSQALHSWFAHIPGLRVVMPATVADARDLLIASVLAPGPVLYIDERWLYEQRAVIAPAKDVDIDQLEPEILKEGSDITVIGLGYGTMLVSQAAKELAFQQIKVEVIDVRLLNPLRTRKIIDSVKKTRRLLVVDAAWKSCGFAAELISSVVESVAPGLLLSPPTRVTLPDAPAPTSAPLEKAFYFNSQEVLEKIRALVTTNYVTSTSVKTIAAAS